jgi:hypothetical protein
MSDALRDLVRSLRPIHETKERFARGGEACAKELERLFADLVGLSDEIEDVEALEEALDDRERTLNDREEGLEAREAELALREQKLTSAEALQAQDE